MKPSEVNSILNRTNEGGLGKAAVTALLMTEVERLKGIIRKVWGKYEASYSPKMYRVDAGGRTLQTRRSLASLSATPVFNIDGNTLGVRLNFPDDLYHESVVSSSQPKGHSFHLIDVGWHSKKLEQKLGKRDRFTQYGGYDLTGQIIKEYNSTKPMHHLITIEFEWDGV